MGISKIDLKKKEWVGIDRGKKSVAYFCKKQPVRVTKGLITELKKIASTLRDQNLRFCLHDSPEAPFQNMIILERKGAYYRPHKHLSKGESFHIIEGRMAAFIFNEKGEVIDSCILEQPEAIIYKVPLNSFHAIMPLTDWVIYHEAKPGPFLGQADSIFPEWSCAEDDQEGIARYQKKLWKQLSKI